MDEVQSVRKALDSTDSGIEKLMERMNASFEKQEEGISLRMP